MLLTVHLVPVEIVSRILQFFRLRFQSGRNVDGNVDRHLVLASKLMRVLQRRPQLIQLLTEKRARVFFLSAEQFHCTFENSLPQIAFCEVQILELLLPAPGSVLYPVISQTLGRLSLRQFNLVMQGDSVEGTEFMELLERWGPSLARLEILRIKYKFWKSEDVSNASITFIIILLKS
jgi:hypothetical protein